MANTKQNKKEEIKDVQPIRDLQQIEDMKWALRRSSERDYILFCLGINTGLRVSDLLQLKIKDVKGKKSFNVKEGKTKKPRKIKINGLYDELNAYINTIKGSEWLFPSRKGDKAITRIAAYQALNRAADIAGIESVGTHTMRKTFGYWFYKQYKDVAALQDILNHSKPAVTLRYIGITAEEIEAKLDGFQL